MFGLANMCSGRCVLDLVIRKNILKGVRSHVHKQFREQREAQVTASISLFKACVGAMTYVEFYIRRPHPPVDDHIPYKNNDSIISHSILEHQQCQMECVDSTYNSDGDSFEDTVPVHELCALSSKYGARRTFDKSALLPSDVEQLLRVHKSMALNKKEVSQVNVAIEGVRNEADFVP